MKDLKFHDFIEKIIEIVSIIAGISLVICMALMAAAIFIPDLKYLNDTAVPFWFIAMSGVAVVGVLLFAGEKFFSKTIVIRFIYGIGVTMFLVAPALNMSGIHVRGWGYLFLLAVAYMGISMIPRAVFPEFRETTCGC